MHFDKITCCCCKKWQHGTEWQRKSRRKGENEYEQRLLPIQNQCNAIPTPLKPHHILPEQQEIVYRSFVIHTHTHARRVYNLQHTNLLYLLLGFDGILLLCSASENCTEAIYMYYMSVFVLTEARSINSHLHRVDWNNVKLGNILIRIDVATQIMPIALELWLTFVRSRSFRVSQQVCVCVYAGLDN